MKRTAIVALAVALAATVVIGGAASADTAATAPASVFALVNPNVSIVPPAAAIGLGTIQTGTLVGAIPFAVAANRQFVAFSVAASALYKGDDPASAFFIPVNLALGANITAPNANPPASTPTANIGMPYSGPATLINGFPAVSTLPVTLESSQSGQFNQVVTATVRWTQANPLLPSGEYSGFVALSGALLP